MLIPFMCFVSTTENTNGVSPAPLTDEAMVNERSPLYFPRSECQPAVYIPTLAI